MYVCVCVCVGAIHTYIDVKTGSNSFLYREHGGSLASNRPPVKQTNKYQQKKNDVTERTTIGTGNIIECLCQSTCVCGIAYMGALMIFTLAVFYIAARIY